MKLKKTLLWHTIIIVTILVMSMMQDGFSQKRNTKKLKVNYQANIVKFLPGYSFAYAKIKLMSEDGEKTVRFLPFNGESILSQFKEGDKVNIQAYQGRKLKSKKIPSFLDDYFSMDELISISKEGVNYEVKFANPFKNYLNTDRSKLYHIFLEKRITGFYTIDEQKFGVFLDSGELLYSHYSWWRSPEWDDYKVGDVISSWSIPNKIKKGEVWPIEDGSVYSVRPLTKVEGEIKSFLYKQNYAYIGLVLSTNHGELRFSFPSEAAKELKMYADRDDKVIIYYEPEKSPIANNPPGLYAVISNLDTLKITRPFYGSPDGKHESKSIDYKGEIRKIIKDSKGNINAILTRDALIESTTYLNQLRKILKKGMAIEVAGEERIKRPGEVYEKDLKIITPKSAIINGKEYLFQQ